MASRGVHFALTPDELAALRACPDDDARLELLHEEIEETLFAAADRVCETDKAWDAIHRCLTDGTLEGDAEPGCFAILDGEHLYEEDDYLMVLKTPAQVQAVAAHIAPLTESSLRQAYDQIDPDDYDAPLSDEDFAYTWTWFEALRTFFARAAADAHHVLFTADG